MASQEMLKKLLEEFDEKEAQNREEMNIINLRVEELEKRISSSKKRLDKVGSDRQKVAEMMNRYAGGNLRNGTFVPAGFVPKPPAPTAATTPAALSAVPAPAAIPTASASAAAAKLASAPAATPPAAAGDKPAEVIPPAEPWGIVKTAPPTPIIFDAALGSIAASAPLPFSTPSAAPLPFGSASGSPASIAPLSGTPAAPSISAPVTSAAAAAAASGSSSPATPPALSVVASQNTGVSAPATSSDSDSASASTSEPFASPGSADSSQRSTGSSPAAAPPAPPSQTLSTSPLSSLSAASLFSSPAQTTSTGEHSSFSLDSGASSSPFSSGSSNTPTHTTPLSTPQAGLGQALMQSMPIGGGGSAPPVESTGGAGKFDMMDLFAPLSGDEAESAPVTSEPAPDVAEQALAQNQFYATPATPSGQAAQVTSADVASATDSGSSSTSTQDHPSLDLGEDTSAGAEGEDENDDTVKSINDALRGLFR